MAQFLMVLLAAVGVLVCSGTAGGAQEAVSRAIELRSRELLARIDGVTGMLTGLESRLPRSLQVVPADRGMSLYIRLAGSEGRLIVLDRALSVKRTQDGKRVDVATAPSSPDLAGLADARLEYRLDGETLRIRAEVRLKTASGQVAEIGLGQAYSPDQWDNHWYCNLYFNKQFPLSDPAEPTTPRLFQFDQSADDATYLSDWNDWLQMPLGVTERSDRYMLWGSLDLGKPCVLAPNKEGLVPSFLYRPTSGTNKKVFVFDTFIRFFSKTEADFTSAYRWYAQSVYSTNPITKGIVAMPKDYPAHTVSPGNIGCINTYMSEWGEAGSAGGAWRIWEDSMVAGRMVHQWFGELQTFDGRLPTSGDWWAPYATRKLSAQELKAWIERLHSRGLKVYLYNRQLFGNHRMYDGSPPYREWMKRDRLGNFMPYPCGNLQDYDRGWHEISEADAQRLGVDTSKLTVEFGDDRVGWLYADFDNAAFRRWYIEAVKAQVEYFQADGVAWDMAWFDVHRGIHHGILRVQYEIYQWLRKKHPDKRVLANMAHGNPSSLYADMVFMEGPPWSTQTRAVQAGHAYKLPLNVPLDYADWDLNISEGLKCPALGLTCFTTHALPDRLKAVPRLASHLQWLFDFSARANALPLITDFGAVRHKPDEPVVQASVWGAEGQMMVAAYRAGSADDGSGKQTVTLHVNSETLRTHRLTSRGTWECQVIGTDGHPRSDGRLDVTEDGDGITLSGQIRPGELLLGWTR